MELSERYGEAHYSSINCPQCGFEGLREISVKDEDIAILTKDKEHWMERWSEACNENQVLINVVNKLTMELGDLPEAQSMMLSEIKRLKGELKNEYNRAVDDVIKVFLLAENPDIAGLSLRIAEELAKMKKKHYGT